jgi:hypothetical protein
MPKRHENPRGRKTNLVRPKGYRLNKAKEAVFDFLKFVV